MDWRIPEEKKAQIRAKFLAEQKEIDSVISTWLAEAEFTDVSSWTSEQIVTFLGDCLTTDETPASSPDPRPHEEV